MRQLVNVAKQVGMQPLFLFSEGIPLPCSINLNKISCRTKIQVVTMLPTVCALTPNRTVLYCIVSKNLYSASCSAHQSEALPVRETQREESSLERTKRRTWHTS